MHDHDARRRYHCCRSIGPNSTSHLTRLFRIINLHHKSWHIYRISLQFELWLITVFCCVILGDWRKRAIIFNKVSNLHDLFYGNRWDVFLCDAINSGWLLRLVCYWTGSDAARLICNRYRNKVVLFCTDDSGNDHKRAVRWFIARDRLAGGFSLRETCKPAGFVSVRPAVFRGAITWIWQRNTRGEIKSLRK